MRLACLLLLFLHPCLSAVTTPAPQLEDPLGPVVTNQDDPLDSVVADPEDLLVEENPSDVLIGAHAEDLPDDPSEAVLTQPPVLGTTPPPVRETAPGPGKKAGPKPGA
jgi:hypothetical protein